MQFLLLVGDVFAKFPVWLAIYAFFSVKVYVGTNLGRVYQLSFFMSEYFMYQIIKRYKTSKDKIC